MGVKDQNQPPTLLPFCSLLTRRPGVRGWPAVLSTDATPGAAAGAVPQQADAIRAQGPSLAGRAQGGDPPECCDTRPETEPAGREPGERGNAPFGAPLLSGLSFENFLGCPVAALFPIFVVRGSRVPLKLKQPKQDALFSPWPLGISEIERWPLFSISAGGLSLHLSARDFGLLVGPTLSWTREGGIRLSACTQAPWWWVSMSETGPW